MLYTPQESTASSTAAPAGRQAQCSVPNPLSFPTAAAWWWGPAYPRYVEVETEARRGQASWPSHMTCEQQHHMGGVAGAFWLLCSRL